MPRRAALRVYLAALMVLGLVALESFSSVPRIPITRLSGIVNAVVLPLEVGTNSVVGFLHGAVTSVSDAFTAEAKNRQLSQQVSRLQSQVTRLQVAAGQNAELRKLLKLRAGLSTTGKTLTVPVVGRTPVNWLDQMVIAAGTDQGVRTGDAVLAPGGLVGRVVGVGPLSATVMLLPDPESAVGAMVVRSRDAGVLLGTGQASVLTLQFFSAGANVRRGDLIVTSGLDRILPKGLPLGRVVSIRQGDFGLVREAMVAPLADLNRLEDVLVLIR